MIESSFLTRLKLFEVYVEVWQTSQRLSLYRLKHTKRTGPGFRETELFQGNYEIPLKTEEAFPTKTSDTMGHTQRSTPFARRRRGDTRGESISFINGASTDLRKDILYRHRPCTSVVALARAPLGTRPRYNCPKSCPEYEPASK
ncbi:hypothetical protein J6590_053935 [Homalodisca vitripennis]|nr:hypothetical protein J6590_053935 [Homalodisca vitripennis]